MVTGRRGKLKKPYFDELLEHLNKEVFSHPSN